MTALAPDQIWWTAEEIAASGLPDLPGTKRRVNAAADRGAWRRQAGYARRRAGRGGGWEYHWHLFPRRAQRALIARAAPAPVQAEAGRDTVWQAFDALPEHARGEARRRLEIIQAVEALEDAGVTRDQAVRETARVRNAGARTIWNWLQAVDCVRRDDRLAYLAPRYRRAAKPAAAATCDPEFLDMLKSDYLRLERPSFTAAYRRAVRVAEANGWATLTEKTARRRLDAEVSEAAQIYARRGVEALKRLYPAQERDRRALAPMEAVNADYHKWDVFVRMPRHAGDNEGEIVRPQMVAMQDVYSGRILSWRISRAPNKTDVSLAIGDMVERFGIPDHMLLDNGREFANKFLTGQAATRHRFKIRDDDIQGVLVSLGINVHWATPYSGQSKPIERAFRDMCDAIAKDPRLAGAYTGNTAIAKPENYGSRAIDLDDFLGVVAEGIEEHNARPGRRSDSARGRSFIETFDAAYAQTPIRRATEEQRRLWLMGAEGVRADSGTGEIRLMDNRYWADWAHDLAGKRVTARFDPEDLWAGLHIYALDGAYQGHLPCLEKAGFFDVDEARSHARARKQWMDAEKRAAKAARRYQAADLGAQLDAAAPAQAAPVAADVVRATFGKPAGPAGPAARAQAEPEPDPAHDAFVASFADAKASRAAAQPEDRDEALERFRAAVEMEARLADGEAIRPDQQRWLSGYQRHPEYQSYRQIMERHGAEAIGDTTAR